jgi:hypothetical protein
MYATLGGQGTIGYTGSMYGVGYATMGGGGGNLIGAGFNKGTNRVPHE